MRGTAISAIISAIILCLTPATASNMAVSGAEAFSCCSSSASRKSCSCSLFASVSREPMLPCQAKSGDEQIMMIGWPRLEKDANANIRHPHLHFCGKGTIEPFNGGQSLEEYSRHKQLADIGFLSTPQASSG